MSLHRNAKLGLGGRYALVCAISDGITLATAQRWWHRWRDASEEGRRTLSCLFDRSREGYAWRGQCPRARRVDLRLPTQDRLGPLLVAGATGFAHATVWKVLKRGGLSRSPRALRERANSYEWPCPGDLLHMDTSEYARLPRPGHRVPATALHRTASTETASTAWRERQRPFSAGVRRDPLRRESSHRR